MNLYLRMLIIFIIIVLIGGCVANSQKVVEQTVLEPKEILIQDLDLVELVKYAESAWILHGLNHVSLRLLYRGLSLDSTNAQLLQTLADVYVEDMAPPAAVVYAYIRTDEIVMTQEEQLHHDRMFSSAMWLWGLSRRKDGQLNATLGEIYDQPENDLFIFDMKGFDAIVNSEIELAGSLKNAVMTVFNFSGLIGGCLIHETKGKDISQADLYNSISFIETEEYSKWLLEPVSILEELKLD